MCNADDINLIGMPFLLQQYRYSNNLVIYIYIFWVFSHSFVCSLLQLSNEFAVHSQKWEFIIRFGYVNDPTEIDLQRGKTLHIYDPIVYPRAHTHIHTKNPLNARTCVRQNELTRLKFSIKWLEPPFKIVFQRLNDKPNDTLTAALSSFMTFALII